MITSRNQELVLRQYLSARLATVALLIVLAPALARAQVTPGPGATPPDDTPSIKVGGTLFFDYTMTTAPKVVDANGDSVTLSAFNIGRAYVNVTGQLSHLFAFRVTPDIARETGGGSSLNGSLTLRLKYAYAQLNLDDWMPRGSWVRFGLQQTPWIDFEESVYRYRFQGPVFTDREGYLSSSDAGLSAHVNLPANYGDVQAGFYNGETYSKPEVNDQKSFQARLTLRPFAAGAPILRGLRLTGYHDADRPVAGGARTRTIGSAMFQHARGEAGIEFVNTSDRATRTTPAATKGSGFSAWASPRISSLWSVVGRYDQLEPSAATDAKKTRTLVGVAYWPPLRGSVSTAWMLDLEKVNYDAFTPTKPRETRLALHGMVTF